jgi:hypothetical protein
VALFLCAFSIHNVLCPLSRREAPSDLELIATLLLWTTYALLVTSFWYTANIIVPIWISLAFRGALAYAGSSSPWLVVPALAAWGLSVFCWVRAGPVRAYADGRWADAAEKRDAREQIMLLMLLQEDACQKFSSQMLAWLLSVPAAGGKKLVMRVGPGEESEAEKKVMTTLWTEALLLIFRPTPVEARLELWPGFEEFLHSAKQSIAGLNEDMAQIRAAMNWSEDLDRDLERVHLLIQMTVDIWEGLYAELMHPLGKGEAKRPEVGDRLPKRINHAITWFMAVETKGIKIIVPAQDPVQDAKDVAA